MSDVLINHLTLKLNNETGLVEPMPFDNLLLWKKGSYFILSNGVLGKSNGYYNVVNGKFCLKLELIDGKGPDSQGPSVYFDVETGKDIDLEFDLCVLGVLIGQRSSKLSQIDMEKLKVGSIVKDGRGFIGTLVSTQVDLNLDEVYSWKVTYYSDSNGEELNPFYETYNRFGFFDINEGPYSGKNICEVLYSNTSF